MNSTLRSLLVPLAAVGAVALPVTVPAHAATGYDRCPVGFYCLFSGLDGTGDIVRLNRSAPDLAALGMDDRAESDWNRTGSTIHLWSDRDYSGCTAVTSTGPTGKGDFFPAYRDFFSSVQFDGPGGPSCGTPPGGDR
ncbi:peptidase inhibitor family I36 protein [Kitasatospora sp. NPDC093806]|uniref:peptidase inhibitor family I36 protein n=1 Tax=Kitasatospora sp. NPDC093806 TaxID=3155075 RepID=UPI0034329C6B